MSLLAAVCGSHSLACAAEKIVIKGSDTLGAKMVPQLAEEFKASLSKEGVEVIFEIAAEGSSTGIAAVIDGTAELGMSSREVKGTELTKGLLAGVKMESITVAKDGIAIIVNKGNPMDKIRSREVEKIFTGDVANWATVNGRSGAISIYTRNTSSGTYAVFQDMALRKRDYAPSSQKMAGNEQIAEEVAKNINGIGYVGLAYTAKKGIKAIQVDLLSPTPRFAANSPLSRKLYYYTDGEPVGEVAKFITWATSAKEAAEVVDRVGFIPNE